MARINHIGKDLIAPEWKPQPNEKANTYHLFQQYRDMGAKRSLPVLSRMLSSDPNEQKILCRLCNNSAYWNWPLRCMRYEEWLEEEVIAQEIKDRKGMNKRLAEHAKSAEVAIMIPIKKFLEKFQNGQLKFENIPDRDLFYMVARAVEKLASIGDFERKVRGEPTETIRSETTNTNINLNTNYNDLSHEELKRKAGELGFVKQRQSDRDTESA